MDNYFNIYDSLNKKIVYNFTIGMGGIGDCIKFFMYVLELCIKYNIKLYYKKNNIPIEKYIKLKNKKMYIENGEITNHRNININDIENIKPNIFYIVTPFDLYDKFSFDSLFIPIQDIFEFSEEVKQNSQTLLNINVDNYSSIHLRRGDKYLICDVDKKNIECANETREFDEVQLINFIKENSNYKDFIFFCDNYSYKQKIKKMFNNILICDGHIVHTGIMSTTDTQALDTITEFYFLVNSKEIFMFSNSGFPIIASKFKNIPLHNMLNIKS
jgi:hypothetical protein